MNEKEISPTKNKVISGILLFVLGIVITFIVFRLFPLPKGTGFDGLGSLLYAFFLLFAIELLYIIVVMIKKRHIYSIFFACLALFLAGLIVIRWMG